jgi:hypothetical protein
MTKKHTALNQGEAAALPETNQAHTMNTQNPDLIQHADGGITMSARRTHVCLNAAWEIEGLARLMASLPTDDEGQNDLVKRGLCARILQLNGVVMSGLGSIDEPTDGLESIVYLKLRGEIEG